VFLELFKSSSVLLRGGGWHLRYIMAPCVVFEVHWFALHDGNGVKHFSSIGGIGIFGMVVWRTCRIMRRVSDTRRI
jgi:hypothetical protein